MTGIGTKLIHYPRSSRSILRNSPLLRVEAVPHCPDDLARAIRLGNVSRPALLERLLLHNVAAVSAGHHDSEVRLLGAELVREFAAGDSARHHHVCEQKMNRVGERRPD